MLSNMYRTLKNIPVSTALQLVDDFVDPLPRHLGIHKYVSCTLGDDRNDGFNRTVFSRSKRLHSRIRKYGKHNKRRYRKPWNRERHLAESLRDLAAIPHTPTTISSDYRMPAERH